MLRLKCVLRPLGLGMAGILLSAFGLSSLVVGQQVDSVAFTTPTTLSCSNLASLSLPQTQILLAQVVPAGTFTTPQDNNPTFQILPAFCRVVTISTPTTDSQIKTEVWMPMTGWVGRFEGRGNGGFAGAFDYGGMAGAIYYGYATASTDTGHTSGSATDATWALGHPQKVIDFGWRGVHLMTTTAKAILQAFYKTAPAHSYFVSCSDGGREALMEAQRFPLDYNGILAGDPANNWTRLMANGAQYLQAMLVKPGGYISVAKLPALNAAVLAACNQGLVTPYLNNPASCHFDPTTLLCAGAETNQCLTQPEVNSLKTIYGGLQTLEGVPQYPGLSPGGELGSAGWSAWITGSAPGTSVMARYVTSYYADMVYQNPGWTYADFQMDKGLNDAVSTTSAALDAVAADLTPMNTAGGKLILYQGWSDAAIAPTSTIQYYNRVVTAMGSKNSGNSVRLFMVPGMQHCQNGPGPAQFGQSGPGPNTPAYDANHSVYKALETWVEQGIAPRQIITTGQVVEQGSSVTMTRPLCAYPLIAKYKGTGDFNNAANFSCGTP